MVRLVLFALICFLLAGITLMASGVLDYHFKLAARSAHLSDVPCLVAALDHHHQMPVDRNYYDHFYHHVWRNCSHESRPAGL